MPAITRMSVTAETILDQIGINRMSMMIGVNAVMHAENSVQVRFRARGLNGINLFKITLDPSDTYNVQFYKITKNGATLKREFSDVYADMLIDLIETTTGLACQLSTPPRPVAKPVEVVKKREWLGESLNNGNRALVGIISKQVEWDITQAAALCVELLQDCNAHAIAEQVNDLLIKILDSEG